jgi:hypothetical protein
MLSTTRNVESSTLLRTANRLRTQDGPFRKGLEAVLNLPPVNPVAVQSTEATPGPFGALHVPGGGENLCSLVGDEQVRFRVLQNRLQRCACSIDIPGLKAAARCCERVGARAIGMRQRPAAQALRLEDLGGGISGAKDADQGPAAGISDFVGQNEPRPKS